MEYRILGPVELHHEDREVPLDGVKQRTLLAGLLIAGNHVLSTTEIIEYLWHDSPPTTVNAQIYTYVSRLRKILGPHGSITRRSPGYRLRVGSSWFDLAEFEQHATRGQSALLAGRYEESARSLRSALSLWRGPALVDASEWLRAAEGIRLDEVRIAAWASRVDADLALGRHHSLVPELTRLVQLYPLRERFRAQLMTALYRCDRQADALTLYEQGRRILADELGVDPGALLRDVHYAILTGSPEPWTPLASLATAG